MREVVTDTILVEFNGELHDCLIELDRILRGYRADFPPKTDLWWDTNEAAEHFQSLVNRLEAKAPPGYFFGSHPLELNCLGFWPKTTEGYNHA